MSVSRISHLPPAFSCIPRVRFFYGGVRLAPAAQLDSDLLDGFQCMVFTVHLTCETLRNFQFEWT
jgi:hypothetical protein